jgi:hypothetical protein
MRIASIQSNGPQQSPDRVTKLGIVIDDQHTELLSGIRTFGARAWVR